MGKYEILLKVCETHSISKAAQELHYTQSAVSQAIRAFEKELGFELFYRSRQGMELRPDTEEIVKSLKKICQEQARIRQAAADLSGLDSGFIRIGAIQSISYHWLPDILKDFSRLYPRIRFELTVDGFKKLEQKIQAHEADCIFVSEYSVPDLPFIPLDEDELMLVTPADHPLADREHISLTDISQENFILSSDGLDYETGHLFQSHNIVPEIRYRLNEDFATLKMVEQGFGITILPKLLLKNNPFHVCIRPFTGHYFRTLGVAYSADTTPAPATRKFLDFVEIWLKKKYYL